MKKKYSIIFICFFSFIINIKVSYAQWHVYDSASFGQLVKQVSTANSQLATLKNHLNVAQSSLYQLRSFYDSFAHLTDASQVIPTLLHSAQIYPLSDLANVEGVLRTTGEFSGSLASSALGILRETQYFKSSLTDFSAKEMNNQAANTAGQIAAARILYQSAQNRISGLEDLRNRLGISSDPKQTMDLAARAQVETAVNQAQTQQTLALQMMQQAQQNQVSQRSEQKWRKDAESFEDIMRQEADE